MLSTRYFCQVLVKVGFFLQFFKKKNLDVSNVNENSSSGSPVVPCGQADRRSGVIVALLRTCLKMQFCLVKSSGLRTGERRAYRKLTGSRYWQTVIFCSFVHECGLCSKISELSYIRFVIP